MSSEYTGENIQVLKDLEHVRKRPAMYIGTTGPDGVHHLIWELVDNAVDEAQAGYGSEITVTLKPDSVVEVVDDGRGVPIDEHEEEEISSLQVVFTRLHAGGKFDDEAYQTSGGLHGVGASVVNALAEFMEVESTRDGQRAVQRYERGEPDGSVEAESYGGNRSGTRIRFRPDPEIFPDITIEATQVIERLRNLSFLLPGVVFTLVDEREEEPATHKFYSENGLTDFLERQLHDREPMLEKTFSVRRETDDFEIDVAFNYDENAHTERIESFANNVRTGSGGAHVQAFKTALTRAVKEVTDRDNFQGRDLREGLVAVVSMRLEEPQFEGQTKAKLGNQELRGPVSSELYDAIYRFLSENPNQADSIARKARQAAKAREAAKQAKDVARESGRDVNMSLSSKLSDCVSNDVEEGELFIVEGDSAGGSAKSARDRQYQAILPLKGKIKNVEKSSPSSFLKHDEIRAIITAVGTGIGDEFNPRDLRYGKIICMSDPDVDGLHIQSLLLTLFYRQFRPLIDEGRLYMADPPLYYRKTADDIEYLYGEDQDLSNGEIKRFKGLGEMNPEELWETTMNRETRRLIKITVDDAKQADEMVSTCMGRKVQPRRELIRERARDVWGDVQ